MLHSEHHASHVRIENQGKMLGSHLGDTDHRGTATRVIDEAIQPPEAGHGVIDHRLDAGLDGDISPDEAHGGATFCLQRPSLGFASAGGYDSRTLRDKN